MTTSAARSSNLQIRLKSCDVISSALRSADLQIHQVMLHAAKEKKRALRLSKTTCTLYSFGRLQDPFLLYLGKSTFVDLCPTSALVLHKNFKANRASGCLVFQTPCAPVVCEAQAKVYILGRVSTRAVSLQSHMGSGGNFTKRDRFESKTAAVRAPTARFVAACCASALLPALGQRCLQSLTHVSLLSPP